MADAPQTSRQAAPLRYPLPALRDRNDALACLGIAAINFGTRASCTFPVGDQNRVRLVVLLVGGLSSPIGGRSVLPFAALSQKVSAFSSRLSLSPPRCGHDCCLFFATVRHCRCTLTRFVSICDCEFDFSRQSFAVPSPCVSIEGARRGRVCSPKTEVQQLMRRVSLSTKPALVLKRTSFASAPDNNRHEFRQESGYWGPCSIYPCLSIVALSRRAIRTRHPTHPRLAQFIPFLGRSRTLSVRHPSLCPPTVV